MKLHMTMKAPPLATHLIFAFGYDSFKMTAYEKQVFPPDQHTKWIWVAVHT